MQHKEQASPTPVAGVDVAAIRAWLYDHAATCVIDDGDGDCRHTLPNCESEWCRGCIYVATIAALDALTRAQAEQQVEIARGLDAYARLSRAYDVLLAETRALARLQPAPVPSQWQSIETCPRSGYVIFYYPKTADRNGRNKLDEWVTVGFAPPHTPRKPTHWMPLPAPPVQE